MAQDRARFNVYAARKHSHCGRMVASAMAPAGGAAARYSVLSVNIPNTVVLII
jgi:hypothetical protein